MGHDWIGWMSGLAATGFGGAMLRALGTRLAGRQFYQKPEAVISRQGGIVVAYHPEACAIGEQVLSEGGNAFDAFIATTAAENVLAEGASSLAGPLGVLIYRPGASGGPNPQDQKLVYLDADFNDPLGGDAKEGNGALVPGAPAGLEALASLGVMPLAKLMEPAIALAEQGFQVNSLMAGLIALRARQLKRSDYGRQTYFANGKPLQPGATLALPEVASFLRNFSEQGSNYVYCRPGADVPTEQQGSCWANRFLDAVQSSGSTLTNEDLAQYQVEWRPPWSATFNGYDVHCCSGLSFGGLWALMALKTAEHGDWLPGRRYWEDWSALEDMIRIARQVWSEPSLLSGDNLSDPSHVEYLLSRQHTRAIWERVSTKKPADPLGGTGSHSYAIVVMDAEGNVANGTTTIESEPWGEGLFVEGIPLPASGMIPWSTAPGQRRLSPFSLHLALRDDEPRFAVGAISSSVGESAFQFLIDLLGYGLSVTDTVSVPRFGTFPSGQELTGSSIRLDRNWLDPRIAKEGVRALKRNGIKVKQSGLVDTGLGAVLAIGPDQTGEGSPVPLPYVSRPFDVPGRANGKPSLLPHRDGDGSSKR